MSDFNKDDYLKDLPDVDSLNGEGASGQAGGSHEQNASASAGGQSVGAGSAADQPHEPIRSKTRNPHNLRKITRSMLPPVLPTTARTVTPTMIRTAP